LIVAVITVLLTERMDLAMSVFPASFIEFEFLHWREIPNSVMNININFIVKIFVCLKVVVCYTNFYMLLIVQNKMKRIFFRIYSLNNNTLISLTNTNQIPREKDRNDSELYSLVRDQGWWRV